MVKIRGRRTQSKCDSSALVLEISVWNILFVLVNQLRKKLIELLQKRLAIILSKNKISSTVLNHLEQVGYKQKLDFWVPHELMQKIYLIVFPSAKFYRYRVISKAVDEKRVMRNRSHATKMCK